MVKESPCRDETNIYRISPIAGNERMVSVEASKLVDGKEIVMGTFEWRYDAQKHVLESTDGAFRFTLDGQELNGTLTKDEVVFRRIYLSRRN
jgi:hypothetical protein